MHVLVRDGLFTDGDPPALLGTRCAACGSVHFPRADACTYCATEDPEPIELSRRGMELRIVPLHRDPDGNDVMTYAFAPA
jgi:uncharacterized OB-fold protein